MSLGLGYRSIRPGPLSKRPRQPPPKKSDWRKVQLNYSQPGLAPAMCRPQQSLLESSAAEGQVKHLNCFAYAVATSTSHTTGNLKAIKWNLTLRLSPGTGNDFFRKLAGCKVTHSLLLWPAQDTAGQPDWQTISLVTPVQVVVLCILSFLPQHCCNTHSLGLHAVSKDPKEQFCTATEGCGPWEVEPALLLRVSGKVVLTWMRFCLSSQVWKLCRNVLGLP